MFEGIDISHWQGSINFKELDTDFIIIKAGGSDKGFYKDKMFETYYKYAKQYNIPVGAYYFVGPKCDSYTDGINDALKFIDIIAGKQFEMPVFIDFEAPDASNVVGNTNACIGFCRTMESAGYFTGIYASDISGFKERLMLSRLSDFTLWVARYGKPIEYVRNWHIHQYSSKGTKKGIIGNVDLDQTPIDYPKIIKSKHFNGF